jgi:hypothetical protein
MDWGGEAALPIRFVLNTPFAFTDHRQGEHALRQRLPAAQNTGCEARRLGRPIARLDIAEYLTCAS